jgi:hypothetical protein
VPAETASKPRSRTNPLAFAALVFAILWLVGIGSLIAIVLVRIARGQIDRSEGSQTGRGYAAVAVGLAWLGILVALACVYWYLLPAGPPVPV